jgi:hypothetical protein
MALFLHKGSDFLIQDSGAVSFIFPDGQNHEDLSRQIYTALEMT